MSIVKTIFTEMRQHILSSVTWMQDVYIYNGQDISPEQHNPYPLPCIFVDFGTIKYSTVSKQQQVGTIEIELLLCNENYEVNHLEIFDKADELNRYINSWGTWGGQLDQVSEIVDTNYDRMYVYRMGYTASFVRDSFEPNQWTNISGQYKFGLRLSSTTDNYITFQTKEPTTGYTISNFDYSGGTIYEL